MDTFRFLYRYCRPQLPRYVCGLVLVPLSCAANLSIAYLTGEAVGAVNGQTSDAGALSSVLLWIVVAALVRAVTLFGMRFFIINASREVEYALRGALFRHLTCQDQLFFKNERTGDLLTRISSDVERARLIAGPVVFYASTTCCTLAFAIPLMVSLSWTLTVLLMLPLCLLTVVVRYIGPRVHERVFRAQEALSNLSSRAQENFAGIRVVKSFTQEDYEIESFASIARRYLKENLRAARLQAWMQPAVGAVGDLTVLAILVVGGYFILAGDLTFEAFVKFSGYQIQLVWPMIAIGWIINQYQRGSASVLRLQRLFQVEPNIRHPVTPRLPPDLTFSGSVSVRNLTFSFGGTPVLRDVSVEIPQGHTVAIVGRTGSGKSTLAHLIPRVYPVPKGTIFVDGIDVNDLPLGALRRAIGFVPQESFLFSQTLEKNIAFGVEEVDQHALEGVAALTRLDKDLDQFPHGYKEVIGERGVTLSGGQKQRTALARALLIQPKILILDDSFSAVDTHTEEEIVERLKEWSAGLTALLVSHRIASIRHADRIYVLEEGAVVEEGTHDELVARKDAYAEMYRLQLIADELDRM